MHILCCIIQLLGTFLLMGKEVGSELTAMTLALIWGKNYELTKMVRRRMRTMMIMYLSLMRTLQGRCVTKSTQCSDMSQHQVYSFVSCSQNYQSSNEIQGSSRRIENASVDLQHYELLPTFLFIYTGPYFDIKEKQLHAAMIFLEIGCVPCSLIVQSADHKCTS